MEGVLNRKALEDKALTQIRNLSNDGLLTESEALNAKLWVGVADRSTILQELGDLAPATVRCLIGASESTTIPLCKCLRTGSSLSLVLLWVSICSSHHS